MSLNIIMALSDSMWSLRSRRIMLVWVGSNINWKTRNRDTDMRKECFGRSTRETDIAELYKG